MSNDSYKMTVADTFIQGNINLAESQYCHIIFLPNSLALRFVTFTENCQQSDSVFLFFFWFPDSGKPNHVAIVQQLFLIRHQVGEALTNTDSQRDNIYFIFIQIFFSSSSIYLLI